ncbi:MAG: Holliday junction branch migration protein RuvA, partial [Candidatus Kerfeldbacteria bacterium]|nr:Holliday junction branch migration protein RuvA [Candidatus Kerfeldbacteria bacterium]
LTRATVGSPLELFTYQYMREDAIELYGFREMDELLLFEQIIGVSGVGPKLGLGVLSLASVPKLKAAIANGDAAQLTKVSGIGKKTAERIIVDLREKMGGEGGLPQLHAEDVDAIDVLMRLGYTQVEAREAIRHLPEDVHGTEERVRAALASLGRKSA